MEAGMTAVDPMDIGAPTDSDAEATFRRLLHEKIAPRVLELGTLRWEQDRPTHHAEWLPNICEYVKSDVEYGPDVDIAADAHDLVSVFGAESFDAVIAVSVWEHLQHPWVCAQQAAQLLRPGGLLYVSTHHCFPTHGYPADFTRWTAAGLAALFEWSGLEVLAGGHQFPCTITPPASVTRWNAAAPAWLNVDVCAVKR